MSQEQSDSAINTDIEAKTAKEPQRKPRKPARGKASKDTKEKYFRVSFHAKSDPNAPNAVTLGVNGDILIIRRETEVVLPESYLEVADHAVYSRFRQLPGESRKVIGKVQTFPYNVISEATREEYLEMRRNGTAKTQDYIKRYGMKETNTEG